MNITDKINKIDKKIAILSEIFNERIILTDGCETINIEKEIWKHKQIELKALFINTMLDNNYKILRMSEKEIYFEKKDFGTEV